jgi:type IV pilus assembly protein PilK
MVWSLQTAPELSDQEFDQWNKLLEERTGVQVLPQQRTFLQTQIGMRMRELGLDDYRHYYQQVIGGLQGIVEWSILVDRLVVKETSFFRHRASIDYIRRLVQNRIDNQSLSDGFEVWSVGCSTGEEPFSLAMVINDCFELAGLEPYYGITATDISQPALQAARQGIYSERKLEPLAVDERARYVSMLDDNRFKVSEKLSDRICFSHGNILKISQMPMAKMDVIYCQNLLIYFRRWRRKEILNEMIERLKPGGVLVIGLGEVVDWEPPGIERVTDDGIQAYIKC